MAQEAVNEDEAKVTQVCRVLDLSRSTYYYEPSLPPEEELEQAIRECHEEHDGGGFYQLFYRIRHQGKPYGRVRMLRAYHKLNLSISRRKTKKKPAVERAEREGPSKPNEVWAMDFVSDQLEDGTPYRVFNVIDEYTREALLSFADTSIGSKQVLELLEALIEAHGEPEALRSDNGPEFTANTVGTWAEGKALQWCHIQPGKPVQNPYAERFNGTLKQELLNRHIFANLEEVSDKIDAWLDDYNNFRPHKGLKYQTPRMRKQSSKKAA